MEGEAPYTPQSCLEEWEAASDPQEQLTMSQRVYIESKRLEDNQSLTDQHLIKEQESIKKKLEAFKLLNMDLDEMKEESMDAAKIYMDQMSKMLMARQFKLTANKNLITEVETQIVNAIK